MGCNFGGERWSTVVGIGGHGFTAHGEADGDGARNDLGGDLLEGEEARGAEAVAD
jgi:hypothetical protein